MNNIVSKFPVSLTLNDYNILLITSNQIIFYDSSLSSIIKYYNLTESEIVSNLVQSYKTMACQYPEEYSNYILVSVMNQLYFFDYKGDFISKNNFTEKLINQTYYEVFPIKFEENNLYYIIAFTNFIQKYINFFYYKKNINTKENVLINETIYYPKTIDNIFLSQITDNIQCLIMNSQEKNNIFTCFYEGIYPCQLIVTSFSLENDAIVELEAYSKKMLFQNASYLNYFKAKTIGNKSKAYLVFIRYDNSGYTAIYDINIKEIYSIKKRVNTEQIGTHMRAINFLYFPQNKQFLLIFRNNDRTFTIIVMNENYAVISNKYGKITLKPSSSEYNYFERETIVYLENFKSYLFITDAINTKEGEQESHINVINITSNITRFYNESDEENSDIENTDVNKEEFIMEEEIEKNEQEAKEKEEVEEEDFKKISLEEEIEEELTNQQKIEEKEIKEEEELTNQQKMEEKEIKEEEELTNQQKIEEKEIKEEEEITNQQKMEEKETKEEENFEKKEEYEEIEEVKIEKEKERVNEEEIKKENEKEKEIDGEIIINDKNNKCFSITAESKKIDLCIKCNTNNGYYPVNFKVNKLPKDFKECFNNDTKLTNFYFNDAQKQFEPCFETCNTCNYGGNEEINNCTSCDYDSIFRPEINDTTNCVKKCKFRYYYTKYGQYKCSESKQCPKEANLFIKEKNKCIEDCKLDNIYKFQYNGECLEKCPIGTIEKNNICIINLQQCSFKEEDNYLNELSDESSDLLIRNYATEFKYTNNHISIYKNKLNRLIIYKNKDCIKELNLQLPKIDFGQCYEKIKSNNYIQTDLIILINEKYTNNSSQISLNFYNPFNGDKINTSKECNNENVTIEKDIISQLKESDKNINDIMELAQQNINIFDKTNEFYTDICFNYESPKGKDIPLKDRLKEFYPNITLCNEGCFYKGVNLNSMSSICQCKFTDLIKENSFTENAFVSKISNDLSEIFFQSNFQILKCYENVFVYKYFIKNTGGFIILTIIIFQTICVFIFYIILSEKINRYLFILMQEYLVFLDKTNLEENVNNINQFLKSVASPIPIKKGKKEDIRKKKKHQTVIYQNNSNIIKLNIKKIEIKKKSGKDILLNFKSKKSPLKKRAYSTHKISRLKNLSFKNSENIILKNNKKKNLIKNENNYKNNQYRHKLNKFMEEYLSTDIDELDYDDAIIVDKRNFCQYFWEKIKYSQFILDILLINDPIKPRAIKILLFLINLDLYFLINSLFMNEDYISKIYHSDDTSFFSFIKRTDNNLFYISTIGIMLRYLITCFLIEEKKVKKIFIREKENTFNIKKEIYLLINNIKIHYLIFFIIGYIITIFSWYFVSCFNNVYPYTKKEWMISSISIFLLIQIVYLLFSLFETILRFLSFKMKSEKLFKISHKFN